MNLDQLRADYVRALEIYRSAKAHLEERRQALTSCPEWGNSIAEKPFGSRDFAGLRAEVREYRKWDKSHLTAMRERIPANLWPFKTEYKEDKKAAKELAMRHPELWAELQRGLSVTAGAPSFSLAKGDK